MAAGPVFWIVWMQFHPPQFEILGQLRLGFWLSVVVLQPALEEFLFRGMLQGTFLHSGWGSQRLGMLSFANIATALIFAFLHLLHHPPLWAAAIFFPALLFGLFRDRSGCIYAAFLLHAFYNLGYFLLWPL